MLALVALLFAQGALLGVEPVSESTCPTPVQVTTAIAARLPGVLVEASRARGLGALRLRVQRTAEGQPAFAIIDPQDRVRLYRILENTGGQGTGDCLSLAETMGLIVDRFLQELDARSLRKPDPARLDPSGAGPTATSPGVAARAGARPPFSGEWRLSLVGSSRPSPTSQDMFLAALRGARAFPRGLLLGGSIGVSMRQQFPEAVELGGGVSGLRVLPLDLSAHFRLSLGPGTLESGIAAGLDVLFLDDRPSSGRVSREVRLAPWVGPLVAYSLPLVRGIFARAVAGAGVHAIRYEAARGRQPDATFSTGRVHATLELEVGFAF